MDPSQWGAYYGYGQGYDAYAYGAVQDPSLYAYNAYAGYAQYPQHVLSLSLTPQLQILPLIEEMELHVICEQSSSVS